MRILSTFAGLFSICLALTLRDNGLVPKLLPQLQLQELQNESFALSTGKTDRLIFPIPGHFPQDLMMSIGPDPRPPFLKTGQVVYNNLGFVSSMWQIQDPERERFTDRRLFRCPEFKVVTFLTPTLFDGGLPVVTATTALMLGTRSILRDPPFSSVTMKMFTRPSEELLGTFHILALPDPNQVSLSNDIQAIDMTPAVSNGGNISTTTGQGIATNSTCTPACPPLTAARPISENDWLWVFTAALYPALTHLPSDPISSLLSAPEREMIFFTRDDKVKCVIFFYDQAFDPTTPFTMLHFVSTMLQILRQCAEMDRWREGLSTLLLGGERMATMRISRTDPAGGSADEVATA